MKSVLTLSFMIISVLLSACGLTGRGLAENRQKWNAAGIDDYRIKVKISKTGHAAPMGVVMIEVRDGQMVSTTKAENEWLGGYVEKCEPYDTIPEIFDLIERAEKSGPDELDVAYDSTLGYPTKLRMDTKRRTLDDELSWEVLQFEKLN